MASAGIESGADENTGSGSSSGSRLMPSLTMAFYYNKIQPKVKRFVDFFCTG
jgi:hypothetical protein